MVQVTVLTSSEAELLASLANVALAETYPAAKAWASGGNVDMTPDPWARKAGRLAVLQVKGVNQPVRCDEHPYVHQSCDRVPVSWALLGHTCGRSDGAA